MSYAILIGTPEHWSQEMAVTMAERLMADSLPSTVSVAVAVAAGVDLPLASMLLRPVTNE